MTLIVGIVDTLIDAVWMGADSGVTSDDDTVEVSPYTKLFAVSSADQAPVVVGCCGSVRFCQLMKHVIVPPLKNLPPMPYIERWLVTSFYKICHDALVEHGMLKDDAVFDIDGSQFLIGIGNRLFMVDNRFEVVEATRGYDAIGSGRTIALGSLHTSYTPIMNPIAPRHRIYKALDAATDHMPHIRPPFMVMNTRVRRYEDLAESYGGNDIDDNPNR